MEADNHSETLIDYDLPAICISNGGQGHHSRVEGSTETAPRDEEGRNTETTISPLHEEDSTTIVLEEARWDVDLLNEGLIDMTA